MNRVEPNGRGLTRRLILTAMAALTSACAGLPQAEGITALRAVTYNIKHGYGADGTVDLERIARVLRRLDADIILLQEVDQGCARSHAINQAQWLGEALQMEARFGPFRPYDGGLYGMAALSRLPIEDAQVVPLPPGPNPLSALELRVNAGGRPLIVAGLHLVQTEAQRLAQARFLCDRYANESAHVLLAGDLNSERGSSVIRTLEDSFDAPPKRSNADTFPSAQPIKEIDFFLLSHQADWVIKQHFVVPESEASDHRPVVIDLQLPPAPRSER